ncbi:MAG TPA: hypothetical protein VK611_25235 [Acidimicrobiales bacterium]|nr:hypothetical protein [Acidimicrobiales bacterium]
MADEKDKPAKGDDDTKEKGDDKPLGDGGERALKAERDARRKAETDLRTAREELAKVQAAEDASKSDIEKLLAKVDGLESRAVEAERKALIADIAAEKDLTPAQARRLQGTTRDELVADAEELVETFGVKTKPKPKPDGDEPATGDADESGDKPNGTDGAKPPSVGRPKEKLRGGASPPDTETPVDPAKLAKSILDSPF